MEGPERRSPVCEGSTQGLWRVGDRERSVLRRSRARARWESNQNLGHCWILRRRERCLLNHINCRDNRCFDSAPSPSRDEISLGLHPRDLERGVGGITARRARPPSPGSWWLSALISSLVSLYLGSPPERLGVLLRARPGRAADLALTATTCLRLISLFLG